MKLNTIKLISLTVVGIVMPQLCALEVVTTDRADMLSQDNTVIMYNKNENGFELINQSDHPIWISIINGSKIIVDAKKIGARSSFNENDVFNAPIDIKERTKVAIYKEEPKSGNIEMGIFGAKFAGNAAKYEFPTSKTIYITYNKADEIVPSTPELPGGINKTRTGFDLSNNVSLQEISGKAPAAITGETSD